MSLLSHVELLHLVTSGVIENCPLELVNGASIDVTLAPKILIERDQRRRRTIINYQKREPLHMLEHVMDEEGYTLYPGEFILASTEQVFHLPNNIAMELRMKSSAARTGLNNIMACWADPTWHGSSLTLELINCTRFHTVLLHPGDRVGQVIFHRCAPVPVDAAYATRGRYNNDAEVSGIKK